MNTKKKAALRLAILLVAAGATVIAFLFTSWNFDFLGFLKALHGG